MVVQIRETLLLILLVLTVVVGTTDLIISSELNGTHSFGQRNINDRLLYRVSNPTGNDGFLTFTYDSPSIGPDINYVEIAVTDVYNQTMAYISSGGIGKKSIVVVLGVLHKVQFTYDAAIYGS